MKIYPFNWNLELSSKCALKCPRCPRTENPNLPWLNKDMSLSLVLKFLPTEVLQRSKRIVMCGDVGDPIYCKDFLKIIEYFKRSNPKIQLLIITNGSYKSKDWWGKVGKILNKHDRVHFSIDGYDDESNNKYRVNSNFISIIDGMTALRQSNHDVFIYWAAIAFSFNEHYLDRMQGIAKELGCFGFQITKSTKFGSKYGGWGGEIDSLEPSPQWVSSSHSYEVMKFDLSGRYFDENEFLSLVEFNRSSIDSSHSEGILVPKCLIGSKGFYVNAVGNVYPCVWLSYPYDKLTEGLKTIDYKDSFFFKHLGEFNLFNRTMDEIMADPLWDKWYENLINPSKTWVECMQKCSKDPVSPKPVIFLKKQ